MGKMTRHRKPFDMPRYSSATPMTDFEGDMEYVALYAGESCDLVNRRLSQRLNVTTPATLLMISASRRHYGHATPPIQERRQAFRSMATPLGFETDSAPLTLVHQRR